MQGDELEEFLGPVGFQEYERASLFHKTEVEKFADRVKTMSDTDFIEEAAFRIEESARWGSDSRNNWEGIHAMATGCYKESGRRYRAAGHAGDCRGDTLYVKAYNKAYARNGHGSVDARPCTCGVKS